MRVKENSVTQHIEKIKQNNRDCELLDRIYDDLEDLYWSVDLSKVQNAMVDKLKEVIQDKIDFLLTDSKREYNQIKQKDENN